MFQSIGGGGGGGGGGGIDKLLEMPLQMISKLTGKGGGSEQKGPQQEDPESQTKAQDPMKNIMSMFS
jgi:hypothetical protein